MPSARHTSPPLGRAQLGPARQPHERQLLRRERRDQRRRLGVVVVLGVAPGVRQARAPHVVDHLARRGRRPRPDDLDTDALVLLQRLAARDERREQHVAERAVLEQQRPQHVALDGDVAHRLRRRRPSGRPSGRSCRLSSPRKPDGAVADDLVARAVEDRRLALEDRDERVALVADLVEDVAGRRRSAPRRGSRAFASCAAERIGLMGMRPRLRGCRRRPRVAPAPRLTRLRGDDRLRTRAAVRRLHHARRRAGRRGLELAQLADVVGLDLVTFQDHPYQARFLDTWTLLSVVAAQTTTSGWRPNVANLPLRPPVVLASSVASLDLLSGGRVELGLGAGAFWDAIAAAGRPAAHARPGASTRSPRRSTSSARRGTPAAAPSATRASTTASSARIPARPRRTTSRSGSAPTSRRMLRAHRRAWPTAGCRAWATSTSPTSRA